jgi:predicted enzyme related to lactoylglutathione lyase
VRWFVKYQVKDMMKDVIHFYRVVSLDKARLFYGDLLGFTLDKDQGKCLIYDAHSHGKIGFCTHFPKEKLTQSCITLVYENQQDVDDMYLKLNKLGKHVSPPEVHAYFNIYHFFIQDDNDLMVEFQTFL